MSIRLSLAIAAAALIGATSMATTSAEAGFKRDRAAKAAPAPAPRAHAACPLTAMMARVHNRVHAARPARAERPARVARAKPVRVAKAAPAPKKAAPAPKK